jgi:hypothetical protein
MSTHEQLQDLRRRILDHEAAIKAGTVDPNEPPYTIDELKEALRAISINRAATLASPSKAPSKAKAKAIPLDDLL